VSKDNSPNQNIDEIYDAALLEQLMLLSNRILWLESEVKRLQEGGGHLSAPKVSLTEAYSNFIPQDRLDRLERSSKAIATELQGVHKRVSQMRFDRQLRTAPQYIIDKFRGNTKEKTTRLIRFPVKKPAKFKIPKKPFDLIVLCPVYPGGSRAYGGEFIQKRVTAYKKAKISVCVLEVGPKRSDESDHLVQGVRVLRCGLKRVEQFLNEIPYKELAIHQLERPLWNVIKPLVDRVPINVWIHGFEARHWKELEGNYSKNDLKSMRKILNRVTKERKATMQEILPDKRVRKIFVSEFMKYTAESFARKKAINSDIIHNQISKSDFPYKAKKAKDRFSVLWVRSFDAHNYANDLSRDALLELSRREIFTKMNFTIYGDGKLFDDSVDGLRRFSNVSINRQFVSTQKLRELHGQNGIMLVPTRWDSQGLTCGEAMSSGLVPVTNSVAALPEFVDDTCGMLCPPNDPLALADAIEACVSSPKLFLTKSKAAAVRAQKQCGNSATVVKEIRILKTRKQNSSSRIKSR
jgi:glycosyltransferase involved in cell wall biosynthesis